MAPRNVIECEHITHYYGNRLIYRDLSFCVGEGKILGLLGKNGTGKTTIINILMGYLEPTAGECRIFGERMGRLRPATKARIGLLLEGHVQHTYFTVSEIEHFYSRFYPRWDSQTYYSLVQRLRIAPDQKISTMSCGQRSQIALGLLMAQQPDLLILDDFSMGLDPGYRRLFIETLREFVHRGDKTVFLTSHIIQDMEQLIDDCIIFDYGKVLLHRSTDDILKHFVRYTFESDATAISATDELWHPERVGQRWEVYSFVDEEHIDSLLSPYEPRRLRRETLTLEDAFIGMTGKY